MILASSYFHEQNYESWKKIHYYAIKIFNRTSMHESSRMFPLLHLTLFAQPPFHGEFFQTAAPNTASLKGLILFRLFGQHANRRRSSQRNLSSGHTIIVHTSTHVVERVQCQTSAICFHDAWNDMVAQRRFIADECYWWLVISMKAISSRTSRRDVERADFKNQFISTRLRITQLMSSF